MRIIVKYILASVVLLSLAIPAKAEWEPGGEEFSGKSGNDFGLWMTAGIEKKINKKWSVGTEFEYRLKDNIDDRGWGEPARWTLGIGAEYKVLKWLKLDGGYKFMRDHSCATWNAEKFRESREYWGTKHRFYFSATASYKYRNVKFSLRERWQYTYRLKVDDVTYDWEDDEFLPKKSKGKNVRRSRVMISYDKKKAWYEPFVSVEMYHGKGIEKMRYTAGCKFKAGNHSAIEVYYRFQDIMKDDNFNDRDSHILGVGYNFEF